MDLFLQPTLSSITAGKQSLGTPVSANKQANKQNKKWNKNKNEKKELKSYILT